MTEHPYANAPDYRRWRQAMAKTPSADVDPVVSMPFTIAPTDRIVSAGSCFAQHIARHLSQNGFNYLVTEPAHPILAPEIAEQFGYGLYSARYGNIYTARQLLQLLRRAYGTFSPRDDMWEAQGRFFDPYRPAIQPDGFATAEEFAHDREQHFAAVRAAFETMDVFVFTLGLTECWISAEDGAVYPACPGTVAGEFDPARHIFVNFRAAEIVEDIRQFVAEVRERNPAFRVALTVSPVPLAATAADKHVLVSTTYSKSVLRVAAEELSQLPNVAYFPSYEIVTGAHARGRYFADNLRDVTEEGVEHVMRVFFRHLAPGGSAPSPTPVRSEEDYAPASRVVAAICEEERLDPSR